MKRSGGFVIVELMIAALAIAILVLGGYYVYKQGQKKSPADDSSSTSSTGAALTPPPAKSSDQTKFNIPEFGIQLVNVPTSIKDLTYTYYTPSTAANYTQAVFTTNTLYLKSTGCSIGELDKYPGKYDANSFKGQGNFIKQFKDFWVIEVDVGVPCRGNQTVLSLQNSQINTFKQYVTNPDNLQLLAAK